MGNDEPAMTDSDRKDKGPARKSAAATGRKRSSGGSKKGARIPVLALLLALAAAAAAGWLAYHGERRLSAHDQRLATVERGLESGIQEVVLPRLDSLRARIEELEEGDAARADSLASLRDRLDATRLQIGKLSELVEGGSRRWRLLEIESLLLAANERLQLHRDPDGAKRALTLANRRLGVLDDPRLFGVRERVVDEIAALEALPDADVEGLALTLTELLDRVPELPLASDVPGNYPGAGAGDEALRFRERPWRHFLASVSEALEGMVTIRRTDETHRPLMPPEREFFLYQNLQLKLESARLALFRRDTASYRHALDAASRWLRTYFDGEDPRVAGALETLNDVRNVELAWEAPDIGGSLTELRDLLRREVNPVGDAEAETGDEGNAPTGGG